MNRILGTGHQVLDMAYQGIWLRHNILCIPGLHTVFWILCFVHWALYTELQVSSFGYLDLGTRVLTKGLGFWSSGFSVLRT